MIPCDERVEPLADSLDVDRRAMGVGDEDLLNPAHLDLTLLQSVLRSLAAVKEPYIAIHSQCKRGVIPRRGGRGGRSTQECDIDAAQRFGGGHFSLCPR